MPTQKELLAIGIRTKRLELEEQIEQLEEDIADLQNVCPHPNVSKGYRSSSGNYDPGQDCEWYTYDCPDCGKTWTEEKE